MKPLFRFAPPQRGSDAILPAALAGALLLALFLQLMLRDDVVVPVADTTAAGTWLRGRDVVLAPVTIPAGMAQRSIFAPGASSDAAAPTDPLGGTVVAGAMRIGSRTYAVVQQAGRPMENVAPGGSIAGFRLDAITPSGVKLSRGAERIEVPFGAARAAPAETPPSDEESQ